MNKLLSFLLLLSTTHVWASSWTLDAERSTLHFLSTKNEHISETHRFTALSGQLSDQGKLQVKVDLVSVDTGIGIRDERMKTMLFDLATFPAATLSASLPTELLTLAPGNQQSLSVAAELAVNGKQLEQPIEVLVTRLADGGFHAANSKPLVLNAASFDFINGLAELQKVAGLTSISWAVPVSFNVVFQPE